MFDRESLIDFTKQFKVDRVIEKQDYLNEEIREREKISLVFISDTNGSVTAEWPISKMGPEMSPRIYFLLYFYSFIYIYLKFVYKTLRTIY